MLTTEGRKEEMGGREKTHRETFAHKMMVKIRIWGLEKGIHLGQDLLMDES